MENLAFFAVHNSCRRRVGDPSGRWQGPTLFAPKWRLFHLRKYLHTFRNLHQNGLWAIQSTLDASPRIHTKSKDVVVWTLPFVTSGSICLHCVALRVASRVLCEWGTRKSSSLYFLFQGRGPPKAESWIRAWNHYQFIPLCKNFHCFLPCHEIMTWGSKTHRAPTIGHRYCNDFLGRKNKMAPVNNSSHKTRINSFS